MQPACIIHGFEKAKDALKFAKESEVDIAFLDIEMRGMNGLLLAKNLKEINNAIAAELNRLRNPLNSENNTHIKVQTFGGFEVFVDGKTVNFSRAKSKEVLAYLVSKCGASATAREIAAVLWEDKEYDNSTQSYLRTIIADMRKGLKNVSADDIILKKRNSFSIDINKMECDYYDFQKGNINAVNAYAGEFMPSYSWAEFKVGYLEQVKITK